MLTIIYIQAMALHKVGSTTIQVVHDHDHGTSVMGLMKMGNIVPRAGIEPTYLTFWASVLTIT